MRRVYGNPAEARELGERCAARAKNFSWKAAGRSCTRALRQHGFLSEPGTAKSVLKGKVRKLGCDHESRHRHPTLADGDAVATTPSAWPAHRGRAFDVDFFRTRSTSPNRPSSCTSWPLDALPDDVIIYHHSIGFEAGVKAIENARAARKAVETTRDAREFFKDLNEEVCGHSRSPSRPLRSRWSGGRDDTSSGERIERPNSCMSLVGSAMWLRVTKNVHVDAAARMCRAMPRRRCRRRRRPRAWDDDADS